MPNYVKNHNYVFQHNFTYFQAPNDTALLTQP